MNKPLPSPKNIVMMEDHDKAYYAWGERDVRARTLVHVDAHVDFGWIPEMDLDEIGLDGKGPKSPPEEMPLLNPFMKTRKKMVNIGNYICPAMRDGMVKKFYWVVPEGSWRRRKGLKHIIKQLRRVLKIKRYAGERLELQRDHIRCRIFGSEVIVCCLEGLERIDEPVLLDIDVDFMLTKFIWDDLNPEREPWIFPEELFERLVPKINDIDVLTIAYSVEGGFTPLRFKYLGDELRSLFAGELSGDKIEAMRCKRKALSYEKERRFKDAAACYQEALALDGADASAYFNLSLLQLGSPAGDAEKAAHFYNEAVRQDKSYATIYNNYGILYLQRGELKKAEESFRKLLQLDDKSAAALNGLGHIALNRKRYAGARSFFDDCLCIDAGYPEARLGLGITHFESGRLEEAEELFLGLAKSLSGNPEVFWWLGRIAEKRGEAALAIDHYKKAVMFGGEGAMVHLRLSRLYMMNGLYFRTLEELKRFFQALEGMLS